MARNVIIVGMPRSGTSMTANIFAQKGYFAADPSAEELREGDKFNPNGYWEAETLIEQNVEAFAACGFPHHNTWLFDPIDDATADKLNSLAAVAEHRDTVSHYEKNAPWMWKDPRLCYTVGYWWQMLKDTNTRALLIERSAKDIYNSFLRVGWRTAKREDQEDTFERVDHHLRYARKAIEKFNIPCLTVAYADFKTRPDELAQEIGAFFDLSLTANDLGFQSGLNNASLRGRLATRLGLLAQSMPGPIRRFAKRVIPKAIVKKLSG